MKIFFIKDENKSSKWSRLLKIFIGSLCAVLMWQFLLGMKTNKVFDLHQFNNKHQMSYSSFVKTNSTPLFFKNSFVLRRIISRTRNIAPTDIVEETKTIAEIKNVPEGTFNYGGSVCFAPLIREEFYNAIEEVHPSFNLNYIESNDSIGCGAEIEPLLRKDLSFLINTRLPSSEEQNLAKKQGINLNSISVAIHGVAVYVNESVSKDFITLPQLKDIFLGKITNWQQLGGYDLPIIPVSLYPSANTDLQVLMQLDAKNIRQPNLNNSTVFVRNYTSAIRTTARTPGAISLASAALVRGQSSVKPIALSKTDTSIPIAAILTDGSINLKAIESGSYSLTRELAIIFRNDLSLSQRAGIAYSNFLQTDRGQNFLKRAGFVPVISFRN